MAPSAASAATVFASSDPSIDPLVDENMLDDPRDVLRMRDAVGRLAVLTAHPALAGISEKITFHDRYSVNQPVTVSATDGESVVMQA